MQWNYDELLRLQDYELIMKARDAVIDEIRNSSSEEELKKIPEIRFFLITASIFDMEMQNGGLCQFLVNGGKFHGPMLKDALTAFGAEEHSRVIEDYCKVQKIDLGNLQIILPNDRDPYGLAALFSQLYDQYPFREVDERYFEIDRRNPLESILGKNIRNNLSLFFS